MLVFLYFNIKVPDEVSSLCFASLIFRIICNIRLMYHVITFKMPQIEFVEQCWFFCTSISKFQTKRARCAMICFAQRIWSTDVFQNTQIHSKCSKPHISRTNTLPGIHDQSFRLKRARYAWLHFARKTLNMDKTLKVHNYLLNDAICILLIPLVWT